MGFKLDRTYALRWDGDLEGLEVDIASTSVKTLRKVRALQLDQDEDQLAEILVEHIRRWNLEDGDGQTLAISVENLLDQEPVLLAAIGREWYLAAVGVSAPLDLKSTPSAPSAEESIPMETL